MRNYGGLPTYNGGGMATILPGSQALDYVTKQVEQYGLGPRTTETPEQKAYKAQTNKDFATNQPKIAPGIQFQTQLNQAAQKWFDKGVQYRSQGFDPFNPDYNKPDQVAASQDYLHEKEMLQNLSELRKGVDTQYKNYEKLDAEGKVEGFDDYKNQLSKTKLVDLYNNGGINALPQLHAPLDLSKVDKSYTLQPQTREIDQEVSPGVIHRTTQKYVDIPKAAATYEQIMRNDPAYVRKLAKNGIDINNLYTAGGHNMITNPNDPEDFGHIDEPAIYHQIAERYLNDPAYIKQLPDSIKKKIVDNSLNKTTNPWNGGQFDNSQAANNAMQGPYQPAQDPEFKAFVDKQFENQISKERAYQTEKINGVMRKLPSVATGETTKTDATMANLMARRESLNQGWQRLKISQDNNDLAHQKWSSHMQSADTRKKWVDDIQGMNPDAIKSLSYAIQEVHGRIVPNRTGISVQVPEMVPNVDSKGQVNSASPKKQIMNEYKIDKFGGRGARMRIEQLLNKLPSVGKEKSLKTEPYAPDYNDIGNDNTTADDL